LLAGRDGRLWIDTESDGLTAYDPASETVTSFTGGSNDNGEGVSPCWTDSYALPPQYRRRPLSQPG